jgi:hypothetical protein
MSHEGAPNSPMDALFLGDSFSATAAVTIKRRTIVLAYCGKKRRLLLKSRRPCGAIRTPPIATVPPRQVIRSGNRPSRWTLRWVEPRRPRGRVVKATTLTNIPNLQTVTEAPEPKIMTSTRKAAKPKKTAPKPALATNLASVEPSYNAHASIKIWLRNQKQMTWW